MKSTVESFKVWNQILNSYSEFIKKDGSYFIGEERVLRIETAGKTGTKLYTKFSYINANGSELPCMGLSGATGHGWGGQVQGYLTKTQISEIGIKIVRNL